MTNRQLTDEQLRQARYLVREGLPMSYIARKLEIDIVDLMDALTEPKDAA
jgi:hypothetical protein